MFSQAIPVWLRGREQEMNLAAVFEAEVSDLQGASLHVSAAMFYRLFVNGRFVAFGPARTAKGYARVDVLPLAAYDSGTGKNLLRAEVVGYHCRSLSTCLQPSFFCAELIKNGEILAYTGRDFTVAELLQKEQRAERFSIQRHFGEVWDLTKANAPTETPATVKEAPSFLPRVAPYPHYEDMMLSEAVHCGTFVLDEALPFQAHKYSWKVIPEYWGRFEENEIPHKPFRWLQRQRQTKTSQNVSFPIVLKAGDYAMFDFTRVECGFWRLLTRVAKACDIVIGFSEYCDGEAFAFTRMNCQNVLEYFLPDGNHDLLSFEPYTARFAIVMVKSGTLTVQGFGVKSFERETEDAYIPAFADPMHQKIYRAALRTLAHNAVDLYSDCPSRERAGWLCDSYFTGNAEFHFFGKVPVEDAFLENYRLCKEPMLPQGMLPMCYPADVEREESGMGHHIPQWCMWYVLEVDEYLTKRNRSVDPELFRETVEGIVSYFSAFENEYGLLEDLPSWNFVEWSDANNWTKNVNYPTNFLYAAVLSAASRLYGDSALAEKARHIRKRTAELSFDGELFTDNAVRDENGVLRNTGNTSEAGQYYALLFGNVDWNETKYKQLRSYVLTNFKGAADTGRRFVPVNAFIGLYLRLKALLQLEQYQLILDDVVGFFGSMVNKTETLWEYREMKGSHDHGFASYAAYAMCVASEQLQKQNGKKG